MEGNGSIGDGRGGGFCGSSGDLRDTEDKEQRNIIPMPDSLLHQTMTARQQQSPTVIPGKQINNI